VNGILCIDKPAGFTSFDVVAKLRGMLKTKKIGHGGTLDPMATGVLPVFLGRATKACDILPITDKRYLAGLRLGMTTNTQDLTGTPLTQSAVTATAAAVEAVLRDFTGQQQQLPPMYSAVRVGGRRLYDLARQGVEVERQPRSITIHHIRILEITENGEYLLDVACSKGTYIRTLCHDVGQRLGCGGVLSSLRRIEACGFSIDNCLTLAELQQLADRGEVEGRLLPTDQAFAIYAKLRLDDRQARLFSNGVQLSLKRMGYTGQDAILRLYNPHGEFLALAKTDRDADALVSLKWFGERE
jgi:tRNA pseudouridine55 synthase